MYDILFDFSSSPAGGGIRRLEAYAEFFSKSSLKIHFFIHEDASNREKIQQLVPTTLVHKSSVSKLVINKNYLKKFGFAALWLFSYGIPTKRGYANKNWLHIGNVLPFSFIRTTLSPSLFLKMCFLRLQFKLNDFNNDVVSAESNFSINKYIESTNWEGEVLVLRNGLHQGDQVLETKQQYAIAIGTHPYKRIDKTYEIFKKLKDNLGLNKLIIVGDSKRIPRIILDDLDVDVENFLPEAALQSSLKRASYFISTSEIENSSCAVLEGLQYTKKAILSNIPSHQEIFNEEAGSHFEYKEKDYMIVDCNDVIDGVMVDWSNEIRKMLQKMGF
jgi:glycosyltransferase involved in cell wall biosynthesis